MLFRSGVAVAGNLKVNNTLFMREVIEAGLGVGFLPDFISKQAVASGQLCEVLADAKRPSLTLYALYPNRHFVPPKLLTCIEFMQQWFTQHNPQ